MIDNYFDLLGLEKKYLVDQTYVKSQYLVMQIKFHPDRAKNEQERHLFLEKSIKLNEAEKILKDDYLRAEYMLKLANVEFNDRVLKDALSSGELEEIMDINELVDESEDLMDLQNIEKQKLQEKDKMVEELDVCFESGDIVKALDLTVRLKYLTNLVKNIKLKIKHANSRNF